ncbi:cullin-like protein, putative [Plasmodium reichenowi]|uniref:Cullin-like protein, putative n=1 Tax=Plasmodium reichenowi TaxID=5854 RepID=A0A060RQB4_PLARE|nr:cullin-like protein, putative [Plasmodium reichenowi]
MDPTAVNNYPVFYVKNKDFLNVDNEDIRCSLKRFEEYIHECFSILPYNKIKIQNEEKISVQHFCDVLVFNQCEQIICAIIEKKCNEKTKQFFQEVEIRIKNEEFKNGEEEFLKLFVSIWNNFSLVLIHISDILQSFIAYTKNMCCNFFDPTQIFNYLWKKYINEYVIIKNMFISSICNCLTYDKIYCETYFYEYVCVNICNKYATKGYNLKKNQINYIERLQHIQKNDQVNNEERNKQINKINKKDRINKKEIPTEGISYKIKEEEHIQRGDHNSSDNNNNNNNNNSYDNNNNNSDDIYNSNPYLDDTNQEYKNTQKKKKINDKVLSLSIKISDILNLYDDFERIYKNETYTFYKEKIEKYKKDMETLGYEECKFDFPIIVENYLCHEQIRSRKFLKEHTEISILIMLKDLLLVKNKDVLFKDSYIKYCIIKEKYDPLRSVYLYSLNLDDLENFSNIFFNVVDNIGTELVNDVINKRNNSSLLNNAIIKLTNFKLNVDRIIIMSFRYSSYFMKKWREVFEHFINKGIQAETYMPIILSMYLNNLLTIYNACLRKLKKYYILNKKIQNNRSLFNNLLFEIDWNNYCTQPISETIDFYDISTDSDNMLGIKKYLRKKRKNAKKDLINFEHEEEYVKRKHRDNNIHNNDHNDNIYFNNNLYFNNDYHNNLYYKSLNINKRSDEKIFFHLLKIDKLFKKYHIIGKYIMNMITVILSLFRYVSDKEKFEKYYRTYMCKRLINDSSFNIILDVKVFKTLKKECGAQFTKKIEIILKDMKFTSKALMKFYKELPNNVNHFLKRKKYAVNIIFNESWEYVNTENNVIYPPMIKICNEAFFLFYQKYNKSKNIKFLPLLGLCTLRVHFKNFKEEGSFDLEKRDDNNIEKRDDNNIEKRDDNNIEKRDDNNIEKRDDNNDEKMDENNNNNYSDDNDDDLNNEDSSSTYNKKGKKKIYITVTILQALVLLLFNKKNEYHINEIKELTGISTENIIRYLKTIYTIGETHILIYDKANETLKLNFSFRSKKKFLIVNYNDVLYKDDMGPTTSLSNEDNEIEDKTLHIDAAIVKFLKTNGKSSERKICSFIKDKMDISSNEQIKNRISSLLSREFIFFKNNNYHYEL